MIRSFLSFLTPRGRNRAMTSLQCQARPNDDGKHERLGYVRSALLLDAELKERYQIRPFVVRSNDGADILEVLGLCNWQNYFFNILHTFISDELETLLNHANSHRNTVVAEGEKSEAIKNRSLRGYGRFNVSISLDIGRYRYSLFVITHLVWCPEIEEQHGVLHKSIGEENPKGTEKKEVWAFSSSSEKQTSKHQMTESTKQKMIRRPLMVLTSLEKLFSWCCKIMFRSHQ